MLLKVILSGELCHWYIGEVPFNGAAPVNCPGVAFAHMVWLAKIEPTDNNRFTVMVTVLEVAGLPVIHEALDVSTHDNASLLTGVYV